MIFQTRVAGIPCKCKVNSNKNRRPQNHAVPVYSSDYSDFNFNLLDLRERPAPWLEIKLTPDDITRLEEEYQVLWLGELYGVL